MEPGAQRLMSGDRQFLESYEEWDPTARKRADEAGLARLGILPLPGKQGPLGAIAVGSTRQGRFHPEELAFLVNIANLLRLPLQHAGLFEPGPTGPDACAYT